MQTSLNLKLILLFFINGLFVGCGSSNFYTASNTNQNTLRQKYVYYSDDSLGVINLDLATNGSFEYNKRTDLWHKYSNGRWAVKHDTLILNSGLQKNQLPVKIRGYRKQAASGLLHFGWVVNQRGDILKDAQIFFNNDSAYCMPALEDCHLPKGPVSRVKVKLSENVSSDWIRLEANKNDSISLVVLIDGYLSNYLFFEDDKYVIAGDTLYHLEPDAHAQQKDNRTLVRDRSYFLISTGKGDNKR